MIYEPSKVVSFDVETHCIQPGLLAPPLVCGSVARFDGQKSRGTLLTKDQALTVFREMLAPGWILTGANIPYDILVCVVEWAKLGVDLMAEVFAKYDRDEIFDIQITEADHAIAGGHLGARPDGSPLLDARGRQTKRYSLDNVCRLVLGRENAKANDEWRLRYAELEHIPIADWPVAARTYPVDDAINTLDCALAQIGFIPRGDGTIRPSENLHDVPFQCRAAWALHLGSAWGFRTDGATVDALEARVMAAREKGLDKFIDAGFYKLGKDGKPQLTDKGAERQDSVYLKGLVARAYGCFGVCPAGCVDGKVPGETGCPDCKGQSLVLNSEVVPCMLCNETGRVPALKKDGTPRSWKACSACDGTALNLDSASVPRTEKGAVQKGRDQLFESGDELLMSFAQFGEEDKIRQTYLPFVRKGVDQPLNPRPNPLLANGRVSYDEVIQQLPRKGGVRDCFVSRPGKTFWTVDWGGVELVTHAQSCLWIVGWSELANALNSGRKVHDALGARMAGVSYEEMLNRPKKGFLDDCRQAAKPPNFGFPGGMGEAKLVLQQRKADFDTEGPDGTVYKGLRFCVLIGGAERCGAEKVTEWGDHNPQQIPPTCRRCLELSRDIKQQWLAQWPENKLYFKHIAQLVDGPGYVVQHVSKRVRGGVHFCSAANTLFSELAAHAAKTALWRVTRDTMTKRNSPLYGSRVILFQHDELIGESDDHIAPEAAERVSEIMVAALQEVCPDLAPAATAPPALMKRWYKGADPVRDENGRLVPWEPKEKAA